MFCQKCGKEIDNAAVVCPECGVATPNFQQTTQQATPQPIVINNTATAQVGGRVRRRRSLLLDIFMTLITGGLWLIWVLVRPKYY